MSTYEALIDMHDRTAAQFKKLCTEGDDLIRISEMILRLIDDGVVDLGGPYPQRIQMASRRLVTGRRLGVEALEEVNGLLRNIETMRIRRDVAFELKDDQLVQEQENLMAKSIPVAQSELEHVYTLIEYLKLTVKELAPPRLVVG